MRVSPRNSMLCTFMTPVWPWPLPQYQQYIFCMNLCLGKIVFALWHWHFLAHACITIRKQVVNIYDLCVTLIFGLRVNIGKFFLMYIFVGFLFFFYKVLLVVIFSEIFYVTDILLQFDICLRFCRQFHSGLSKRFESGGTLSKIGGTSRKQAQSKCLCHLSNSGDLLLWVGVRRAFSSSSQELLGQS